MKKSWFAVIGMILILLLPGTMAAAADNITVAGQFEGAYADNVYRFVTADGQEIPAMMEHAGKIMSYTPFQATGYVAYNQAGQPVLIIRNVSYQRLSSISICFRERVFYPLWKAGVSYFNPKSALSCFWTAILPVYGMKLSF